MERYVAGSRPTLRILLVNMRLILCTGIRPSMGTENPIPEEVNYTKITIRVTVMNKVQLLMASEPRKP
jgi:hypothetical protein